MPEAGSEQSNVGLPKGAKVGKYEVIERIAAGGQGMVYKCRDEVLDRFVAMKQISPHLAEDPKFLERFRREAQILAKLSARQPSIVTIHDVLEDEKGLFLIMEYVEGQTLETVLQANPGPVEVKAALQIMWRLAGSLNDIHQAGYIHRDIKPGNLIIQEGLRPRITDFGVAASRTGQTSMVLGTTKYMAPEMFEADPVDGRADIYSLGMVAYEMLVGREKFQEIFADIVKDKQAEALRWMKWHGSDAKAPPLDDVNPNVPPQLAHIVAKMMAKNPDERYASMEELGRSIRLAFSRKVRAAAAKTGRDEDVDLEDTSELTTEGVVSPEPAEPEAAPETAPLPASPALSRRTKLILAGVILASLVGIGLVVLVQSAQQSQQREVKAADLFDRGRNAYDQQNYQQAKEVFEQAASEYPDTPGGRKSQIMVHMSRAWIALLDGERDEAATESNNARSAAKRLQSTASVGSDLYAWSETALDLVRNFGDKEFHIRSFFEARQKAQELLGRGDFDAAAAELEKVNEMRIPAEQREQLRRLRREIDREKLIAQIEQALDGAQAALDSGKSQLANEAYASAAAQLEEAGKLYDQAERVLATAPQAADVLSASRRSAYAAAIEKQQEDLGQAVQFAKAMARADEARVQGNRAEELKHLRAARETGYDDVARRIERVRLAAELDAAIALASGDDPEAAIQALRAYLKKDPGNPRAKSAYDRLLQGRRRAAMVESGNAASALGNWDAAIEHYANAQGIEETQDVRAKLNRARFERQWELAAAAMDAKQYAEAKQHLQQAVGHMPSFKPRVDRKLDKVDRSIRYEQLMDEATALFEKEQWIQARERFLEAAKLAPEEEPEAQRMADAAYIQENIDRGKEALASGDPRSARGFFRIALDKAQTREQREEIQRLIAQTEDG